MLEKLLVACGLNKRESEILLYLVEHGPSLASIIAKRMGMKRSTVYTVLESLMRVGIVTRERQESATYFASVSKSMIPKVLTNHAKQKFVEVEHAAELVKPALQNIRETQNVNLAGFSITTLESYDSVLAQLEESLLGGSFCAIFDPQYPIHSDRMKKLELDFLSATAREGTHIREIAVSGPMTDWYRQNIRNRNHLVREIPKSSKIESDMILINGSVVFLHFDQNLELGIKVVHPGLYRSMMTVFEMLWAGLGTR